MIREIFRLICIIQSFAYSYEGGLNTNDVLQGTVKCSGQIADKNGSPVNGAQVLIYQYRMSFNSQEIKNPGKNSSLLAETTSKKDGSFSLAVRFSHKPNEYETGVIIVKKQGYAIGSARWNFYDGFDNIITLDEPKTIRAAVVNSSNQPVPKADVYAGISVRGERRFYSIEAESGILNTKTDDAGRFVFENIPQQAVIAYIISAEGYLVTNMNLGENTKEQDATIKLYKPSTVTGKILGRDSNKSISGMQISLIASEERRAYREQEKYTSKISEDGKFEFQCRPGTYFVLNNGMKSADGRVWFLPPTLIEVKEGEKHEIELQAVEAVYFNICLKNGINKTPASKVGLGLSPMAEKGINASSTAQDLYARYLYNNFGSITDKNGIAKFAVPSGQYYINGPTRDFYFDTNIILMVENGQIQLSRTEKSVPAGFINRSTRDIKIPPREPINTRYEITDQNTVIELEIWPEAISRIKGVVTDYTGLPIANADIIVYQALLNESSETMPNEVRILGKSRSQTDGSFALSIENIKNTERKVWRTIIVAHKEGFALGWSDLRQFNQQNTALALRNIQCQILLDEPKTIKGTVINTKDEPVPNAEISIVPYLKSSEMDSPWDPRYIVAGTEWLKSKTDNQGRFYFDKIPEQARYSFISSAGGYFTNEVAGDNTNGEDQVQVRIYKKSSLRIKVLEESAAKPASNLQLEILRETSPFKGIYNPQTRFYPKTNEEGVCEVECLGGTYRISVPSLKDAKDQWISNVYNVSIEDGGKAEIVIQASRGIPVKISVRNAATNNVITGHKIYVNPTSGRNGIYGQTGNDGIAICNVMPGEYQVDAESGNYKNAFEYKKITVQNTTDTQLFETRVIEKSFICGKVVNENGQEVPGAEIFSLPECNILTSTNKKGEFFVKKEVIQYDSQLSPKKYLGAAIPGKDFSGYLLVPEYGHMTIKLQPSVTITGIVKGEDGGKINGLSINIYRLRNYIHIFWTGTCEVDSSGHFKISRIPKLSRYMEATLDFEAKGYGKAEKDVQGDTENQSEYDIGQIILPAANLTIKGVVIDTRGEPVAGAELELDRKGLVFTKKTESDSSGHFTFEGLSKGEVTIRADFEGLYSEVIVEAGDQNVTEIFSIPPIILTKKEEKEDHDSSHSGFLVESGVPVVKVVENEQIKARYEKAPDIKEGMGKVVVKITDAISSKAIEEACIFLSPTSQRSQRIYLYSNKDGLAYFVVPEGEYKIYSITRNGYESKQLNETINLRKGQSQNLMYTLVRPQALEVNVLYDNGQLASDADLLIYRGEGKITKTKDGNFKIIFVNKPDPNAPIELLAMHPAKNLASFAKVPDSINKLDITLAKTITVKGKVIKSFPDDKIKVTGTIRIRKAESNKPEMPFNLEGLFKAIDLDVSGGYFEFTRLPPNCDYEVIFSSVNINPPLQPQIVRISAEQAAPGAVIDLSRNFSDGPLSISGKVNFTRPKEENVSTFIVITVDCPEQPNKQVNANRETGDFKIDGLYEGPITLKIGMIQLTNQFINKQTMQPGNSRPVHKATKTINTQVPAENLVIDLNEESK